MAPSQLLIFHDSQKNRSLLMLWGLSVARWGRWKRHLQDAAICMVLCRQPGCCKLPGKVTETLGQVGSRPWPRQRSKWNPCHKREGRGWMCRGCLTAGCLSWNIRLLKGKGKGGRERKIRGVWAVRQSWECVSRAANEAASSKASAGAPGVPHSKAISC